MKTPQEVLVQIQRRLEARWHSELAGDEAAFPHSFGLGQVESSLLRSDYAGVHAWAITWHEWARQHQVHLATETRMAMGGTRQAIPTSVRIDTIDRAAAIVGAPWPERLDRGRQRLAVLAWRMPAPVDRARILRMVDGYGHVDFELLLTVSDWFAADPARAHGLTPRQVPIPGVHAKWLQAHRLAILALTGLEDLGLAPNHPPRVHFTYLDPAHRAAGGRVHDSATVGDTFTPAYRPKVVVISENKDTAVGFLELPGAISVEGMGRGGATAAAFDWLREANLVVYWGDMDRDGYEILDGYRADFGREIASVLMNEAAWAEFEPFGTGIDRLGRQIQPGAPRVVDRLTAGERAVYQHVLADHHDGHRRVEQERIPLARALAEVHRLL